MISSHDTLTLRVGVLPTPLFVPGVQCVKHAIEGLLLANRFVIFNMSGMASANTRIVLSDMGYDIWSGQVRMCALCIQEGATFTVS